MQDNMNFIQFAKYIQNQAIQTLDVENIGVNPGLCSKFAAPLWDNRMDAYKVHDFMRYILGDNLYSNYLGEKYKFTPERKAVCNYLANCSIRTLRRYVSQMNHYIQRRGISRWRNKPIPSIAKALKF